MQIEQTMLEYFMPSLKQTFKVLSADTDEQQQVQNNHCAQRRIRQEARKLRVIH